MENVLRNGNVIEEKSFRFAIRIVRLYKYLSGRKKEQIFSRQLLSLVTIPLLMWTLFA